MTKVHPIDNKSHQKDEIWTRHIVSAVASGLKHHFSDPWNIYDFIALTTAVVAAVGRLLDHIDQGSRLNDQIFAWGLALMWGRFLKILSIFHLTGPFLKMFFTMVFKDLMRFLIVVVLMELPFIAAISYLESGFGGNENFATFSSSAVSFFRVAIDNGAPDIGSVTGSSVVLFSIGIVLLVILLLNLLIAMFSKTIDDIHGKSTQEYLHEMTKVTFEWTRVSKVASPGVFAMSFKEFVANVMAQWVWNSELALSGWRKKFVVYHAGWLCDLNDNASIPVNADLSPSPVFDSQHFEYLVNKCSSDYQNWRENVLQDFSQEQKC
jgi:hypothetical protein